MRLLFDLNGRRWDAGGEGMRITKEAASKHRRHFEGKAREKSYNSSLGGQCDGEPYAAGVIICSAVQPTVEWNDANSALMYQDDTISSVSSFPQISMREYSRFSIFVSSIYTIHIHLLNALPPVFAEVCPALRYVSTFLNR